MEEIGTVNFEDLFDFSPEPLNPNSPPLGSVSSSHSIIKKETSGVTASPTTLPQQDNSNSANFKLSQSVPSNWGSHFSSQRGQASSSSTTFDASIGTLLDELPEQGSKAGPKGKRGRKPGQKNLKTDMKSKLERSRQSARECRARKKLRYQYLDDLILEREKANNVLRDELVKYQEWCHQLDQGTVPEGLPSLLQEIANEKRGL